MSVDFRTACKLSPPLDRLCGIASHDGVGLHILEITKKESQVRKREIGRDGREAYSSHYRSGTHDSTLSNGSERQNDAVCMNDHIVFDSDRSRLESWSPFQRVSVRFLLPNIDVHARSNTVELDIGSNDGSITDIIMLASCSVQFCCMWTSFPR